MELDRALRLLKLVPTCSVDNLNNSFRKLAKTFHPDSNRGRESWAHKVMTELNLAYEIVHDYLNSAGKSANGLQKKTRNNFQVRFSRSINHVLEGIYTYYQYGLDNIMLRYEGVRKFRYSDALRYVRDGILSLERLRGYAMSESGALKLQVFTEFSKAFFQNMLIEKQYFPSGTSSEKNAYRHYHRGSAYLDYAIKDAFFRDELIQVRWGSCCDRIEMSREELMAVITAYHESNCIHEALLKAYLLQVFTEVVKLLHKLRY